MYENKISTATLGGHCTGAKLALATGCYHADRVSGKNKNNYIYFVII